MAELGEQYVVVVEYRYGGSEEIVYGPKSHRAACEQQAEYLNRQASQSLGIGDGPPNRSYSVRAVELRLKPR